ncbi:MAG TPA: phage portal protein [Candidatus Sulfotelmatobacter sp.]|jgi:HK97 family phage portal protein|nr:phage portal protein [Candidatus Sulfotelmatobacter sp.]
MSLIDGLKKLFTSDTKQANPAIFGFYSASAMPKMGEKEFLKAYRGWVFACTNAIAERLADIELKLQQKTKDGWQDLEPDTTNPALDLIHHVNNFQSFYELVYGYGAYQELHGNSFWYLPRSGNGKVSEIWQLDPSRIEIVKSRKDFISGYVFTNEIGEKVPLEPDEIIHFKRFHPLNPYRGMGTVEAAALAIDTDTYASEWQRNFFGNSAIPSAILSSEGTLNQEAYDRIKANWDAKFKGVQNSNKLAVLEGNLKYTLVGQSARDMQFSDGRKDIRDEILAIFRVPKTILGISEDVNFASAQATEYIFAKYVIKPKMKFFVTKLNEFYLPFFNLNPQEWRFTFVDPVPENIEQQISVRESGIRNYYMTPNEARAEIGKEPVEGGDDLYIPTLMQPIAGSDKPEGPTPEADPKARSRKLKKLFKPKRKIYINVKKTAAKRSAYISEQVASNFKVVTRLNEELKSMLLKNLKQKGIAATYKKLLRVNKDEASNELVRLLFSNYSDWVGLLFAATKEGMGTVMEQSGKDAIAETGVDATFDLQNPRAMDYLNEHALENTNSYSDTMKEDIALEVQQGVEQGQSVDGIANTIGNFFDDQSDYRAERLARTETIDAYAQGNLEGYRQSGVVTGKEWLPDESACPICQANQDDGVISLDDSFSSGDDAPPAHPNCECALQPITGEDNSE